MTTFGRITVGRETLSHPKITKRHHHLENFTLSPFSKFNFEKTVSLKVFLVLLFSQFQLHLGKTVSSMKAGTQCFAH